MQKIAPKGDNGIADKKNAAPQNLSAKNDQGRNGNSSQPGGKKNVCSCPSCTKQRDDTAVAVSLSDKDFLVTGAADQSKKTGKQVTVKEYLAGILATHRAGASA